MRPGMGHSSIPRLLTLYDLSAYLPLEIGAPYYILLESGAPILLEAA